MIKYAKIVSLNTTPPAEHAWHGPGKCISSHCRSEMIFTTLCRGRKGKQIGDSKKPPDGRNGECCSSGARLLMGSVALGFTFALVLPHLQNPCPAPPPHEILPDHPYSLIPETWLRIFHQPIAGNGKNLNQRLFIRLSDQTRESSRKQGTCLRVLEHRQGVHLPVAGERGVQLRVRPGVGQVTDVEV